MDDQRWTDLCSLAGTESLSRNRLAAALLDALFPALDDFESGGNPDIPTHSRDLAFLDQDRSIFYDTIGYGQDSAPFKGQILSLDAGRDKHPSNQPQH